MKTVCAKEYVDALRESTKVVSVPITIVNTNSVTNVTCQKAGHVVFVQFEALKVEKNCQATRDDALAVGFPRPSVPYFVVYSSALSSTVLRCRISDDYLAWEWTSIWSTSSGRECVFTFTYLTND